MVNRREFVGALIGVAAAARRAFAMPGDTFRWSISSHMFTPLKPHPETGIKVAAKFGFHGIEPWGNELQSYLNRPPAEFKKILDESGISISSVASGGEYFDTARLKDTIANNEANAKWASYFGVTALKANLNRRLGPEDLSPANVKILAKNLNEVGRRTLVHGVKFAFHPHAWTMMERKGEVEAILEATDPKLVFLTLDTCHASVGGFDPVAFARDHFDRIAHFHFKDTLPVWNAGKGWKGPAPSKDEEAAMAKKLGLPPTPDAIYQRLGTGGVDFPALMQILRDRQYSGWISLDFNYVDMPPGVTIEQDMAAHRDYLVKTLHASLRT